MVFPESARLIFDNNPLSEVIWQARFPKILSISAKPPADFQERIRQRYPIYEEAAATVPAEIAKVFGKSGLSIEGGVNHRFKSPDEKVTVSLADEFVSVSTKHYTTWQDFRAHVDVASAALLEVYTPTFFSRVGLRYVNLISRAKLNLGTVPWGQLIHHEWLGPLAKPELAASVGAFKAAVHIALGAADEGTAAIRFGLEDSATFRIDADCFVEGQINAEQASRAIDGFNGAIGNLFRSAILADLRKALGARQVG